MNALPKIWDIPLLLFLSMIWASSFTMIKIAVPELGPTGVVFVRCSIGAVFMLGIVMVAQANAAKDKEKQSLWPQQWRDWIMLVAVGLISTALPFYLVAYAEQEITSSMTAILMTTGPLAVIVLGHVFTEDEKINRGKLIGVFAGFAAAIYILRSGLSGFNDASLLHPLAAMAAAVCYAIGGLLAKKLVSVPAEVIAFAVLAISALAVGPVYLMSDASVAITQLRQETIWAILWLGAMPSGFAFYLRYFLIKRNGYGFVSYVGYLIPLFAIVIGMIILNEEVTADTVMAMMIILLGLFITRGADDFPWSAHPRLHRFRLRVK